MKNNKIKLAIIVVAVIVLVIGGFFGYKALTCNKDKKNEISPLLYEVTKEGSNNKMYLFGSIHVTNKADMVFPEYVMKAYNDSHYLACEFDSIAYMENQEKVVEDAMKMLYQDGTTIKDHLNEDTYNKLVDFLTKKESYANAFDRYKPYFFVSLFSNLIAKDAKIGMVGGVDEYFETKAHEDKKTILEVESYDYQINIFEELSDEFYDLVIMDEINNYDESVEALKELYNAWKSGNEENLIKYGNEELESEDSYTDLQKSYIEDFNKKLIVERNNGMVKKAIDYFNKDQDVFFMVGALHIVGDTGLAKQLKEQGFNVKKVS